MRRPRSSRATRRAEAALAPTTSRGALGEAAAIRHYRALGFRLVAQRLRTREAEIDALVRKRRLYIALEVKSRSHPRPEAAFDREQLDRVGKALEQLVPKLRPRPHRLRVDAVAVRLGPGGTPVQVLPFPGPVRVLGRHRSE